MKAHRKVSTLTTARETRVVKLLLVGHDHEFDGHVIRRIFDTTQPWVASRSPTLLGALDRIQSDPIDVVLLGRFLRSAEVELFVTDARRSGFEGLILQAAVKSEPMFGQPGSSSDLGLGAETNELRSIRLADGKPPDGSLARSLTPRQKAVLSGVCKGWSNQEVAGYLKCSEGAVKAILQQLFEKIGVRKRTQIVRLALEKGLIDGNESFRGSTVREPPNFPASLGKQDVKKPICIGHFVLDIAAHRAWVRGIETHFTPKEFWLLAFLITHPDELVESGALCELFWRNPTSKQEALRVLIAALRAKIEVSKSPQYLLTERSYGYRFHPFPAVNEAVESDTSSR
jgi:DNA-binding CsgD family transcriptional regulator/DNA-binding winged helix-turn-helix (wHTH) protein